MSIRVRRPETLRLELSQGDHLIVKQDLTAGEYRELMRASTKPLTLTPGDTAAPRMELDPMAAGVALVMAYLVDWTFTDPDGRPLRIADQPPADVKAALDAIDSDSYMEVQRAIQAHQAARTEALAAEKKIPNGPTASDRTLTSVG
jgi:hypothetical protein